MGDGLLGRLPQDAEPLPYAVAEDLLSVFVRRD